ncbi:MAG: type III secretion system outer membrane ring subunit SctC [Pseudomonadota bacterium]
MGQTASSKEPDLGDTPVEIYAYDAGIDQVLRDLFRQAGKPVQVSRSVRSTPIDGEFKGRANMVLEDLVRGVGLIAYDDGALVYVYSAADLTSRSFPLGNDASRSVRRQARDLQLIDGSNTVVIDRLGNLTAQGVPRFLEQIGEIANRAQAAGEPRQTAMDRRVYRMFPLKHAKADDQTRMVGTEAQTIPGVATRVRELIQDFRNPDFEELPEDTRNGDRLPPRLLTDDRSFHRRRPNIEPFPELNAIVVVDYPEYMPVYNQLINELDVHRRQIKIEVTFIDINTARARDLGISYRISDLLGEDSILFGTGTPSDDTLVPGVTVTPSFRGLAANIVAGDDDFIAARITALETNGIANIVNRTTVSTLDNQEALITDTETFFVPLIGERVSDLDRVIAGTRVRVLPTLQSLDGQDVILSEISIDDGTLVNVGAEVPVVRNSSLTTTSIVQPGETLIIGGFVSEEETSDADKVPLIADIPLVGNLFKNTSRRELKTQRLFLITPTVEPLDFRSDSHPILLGIGRRSLVIDISIWGLFDQAPIDKAWTVV